MNAYMIPIALLLLALALVLARSVKSFSATLLFSWVVSLLLCYVDKDTHSVSALFTLPMLMISGIFTCLLAGTLTAVSRCKVPYALHYLILLALSFLLTFLFRSVYSAGQLSLGIFALLVVCYLTHSWLHKQFKLVPAQ